MKPLVHLLCHTTPCLVGWPSFWCSFLTREKLAFPLEKLVLTDPTSRILWLFHNILQILLTSFGKRNTKVPAHETHWRTISAFTSGRQVFFFTRLLRILWNMHLKPRHLSDGRFCRNGRFLWDDYLQSPTTVSFGSIFILHW